METKMVVTHMMDRLKVMLNQIQECQTRRVLQRLSVGRRVLMVQQLRNSIVRLLTFSKRPKWKNQQKTNHDVPKRQSRHQLAHGTKRLYSPEVIILASRIQSAQVFRRKQAWIRQNRLGIARVLCFDGFSKDEQNRIAFSKTWKQTQLPFLVWTRKEPAGPCVIHQCCLPTPSRHLMKRKSRTAEARGKIWQAKVAQTETLRMNLKIAITSVRHDLRRIRQPKSFRPTR
mmetsp:Transcript_28699/g.51945  ORF Transcript_28699/g.51945 Transcript_28699/m.51945 type:complete len:229 (+) Transcript_28699:1234-1920(+)